MPIYKNTSWDVKLNTHEVEQLTKQLRIGNNIAHIRKYRWLSQTDLAKKAWTTQRIISQIESGDYNPSLDLLWRIADALEVEISLLTKKGINWKLLEIFDYILKRIWKTDILKAMKLAYFLDLETKIDTWLNYIRWNWWPFDKNIYQLSEVFENNGYELKNKKPFKHYFLLEKKDMKKIDEILAKYWDKSWNELMRLSYETQPMKNLWATIWGEEGMGEVLEV